MSSIGHDDDTVKILIWILNSINLFPSTFFEFWLMKESYLGPKKKHIIKNFAVN